MESSPNDLEPTDEHQQLLDEHKQLLDDHIELLEKELQQAERLKKEIKNPQADRKVISMDVDVEKWHLESVIRQLTPDRLRRLASYARDLFLEQNRKERIEDTGGLFQRGVKTEGEN